MHYSVGAVFALATGLSAVHAHMMMSSPTPYGQATLNNSPLSGDGSDYPCKLRSGVYDGGNSQTMPLGSTQTLSFKGSAVHGGGSCQVSITYDKQPTKGSTFKVIHSIIGGCPAKNIEGNLPSNPSGSGASQYTFQIPKDLPLGEATLAWTWFNRVGNREMYMNCAPITITAEGGASGGSQAAFSALPDMFKANIGNGCSTADNKDVDFPNPGRFTSKFGSGPPAPPTGTCPAGSGSAGGSSPSSNPDNSGDGAVPSSASASAPVAQTTAAVPYGTALPSNPGGRFFTQSTAPPPAATSTAAGQYAPATTSSVPAARPTGSSGSGAGSGSTTNNNNAVGGAQTGACSPVGAFICLPGGKSFQQCGSGRWTPIMPMAPGTSCAPPQAADATANANTSNSSGGSDVKYQRKAKRHLRFSHVHLRRHHGLSLAAA